MVVATICLQVFAVAATALAAPNPTSSLSLLQYQASYKDARPTANCSGCGFVGDLRCEHENKNHYATAVKNCLWPTYDVVVAARHATGLRCFVVDPSVSPVLEPLVSNMEIRTILADASCVEALPNTTNVKTSALAGGLTHDSELDAAQKAKLVSNREAMGRDAAGVGKSPVDGPYVVLILRKQNKRVLDGASEQLLTDTLKELGERRGFVVVPYVDHGLSNADTMNLFAHANGVVGYSGAAFVNVLFASKPSKPTCVVEMTTFRDLDYSNKNYVPVTNLNSEHYDAGKDPKPAWKKWAVYGVPLQQIIDSNPGASFIGHSSGGLVSEDYLYNSGEVHYVNLTQVDVDNVRTKLDDCL